MAIEVFHEVEAYGSSLVVGVGQPDCSSHKSPSGQKQVRVLEYVHVGGGHEEYCAQLVLVEVVALHHDEEIGQGSLEITPRLYLLAQGDETHQAAADCQSLPLQQAFREGRLEVEVLVAVLVDMHLGVRQSQVQPLEYRVEVVLEQSRCKAVELTAACLGELTDCISDYLVEVSPTCEPLQEITEVLPVHRSQVCVPYFEETSNAHNQLILATVFGKNGHHIMEFETLG